MSTLLCLGMGYVAKALAARRAAAGWRVVGASRSPEGCAAIAALGYEAVSFDDPSLDAALGAATHLVHSAPPKDEGDPVFLRFGAAALAAAPLEWLGYLGTTAVYGDTGGAWVDEASPTRPTVARAQRREAAERLWLESGLPAHVFRLAGIYGPGRNAFVNLKAGKARRVKKPGQVFSRIHLDDIVQVLEASIRRPRPGAIYNVADDLPCAPGDVVLHAATLLGVEPPPEQDFEAADLSPMARTFYADTRRVSNARIKEELGVRLRYPTYEDGLAALLEAEKA